MALRSTVADELRHRSREQVLNDLEELREALRARGRKKRKTLSWT